MRWLAFALLVLAAAPASADVPIAPSIVRMCPPTKTWPELGTCVKELGGVEALGVVSGGHLIALSASSLSVTNPAGVRVSPGIYLFVEGDGGWTLGGELHSKADGHAVVEQLLKFESFTNGGHAGFRIDIGQTYAAPVLLDAGTIARGIIRLTRTWFCSGNYRSCNDAVLTCEVLVHGRAMFAFHGQLKEDNDTVHVLGDRRMSGTICKSNPSMHLGWRPR